MAPDSETDASHSNTRATSIPQADILVAAVRIHNFRSLTDMYLPLESTTTYLVGENNSGKSSVLTAIAAACGSYRPTRDDLTHYADGSVADQAHIDLLIRSRTDAFPDEVGQRLTTHAGDGPETGEWAGIRTALIPSRASPILAQRRTFIRWDTREQTWHDTGNAVPERVSELLVSHLIDASRDLTAELGSRTSDWGRVLADLGVTEEDRQSLQDELAGLGERLQEASPTFGLLANQLAKIAKAQAGVDQVVLRSLPVRLEELARSVEILVGSGGGPHLPLRYQGLGSRSLAALMVFQAVCELRVGADLGVRPHLLTLLEEPEAHLHPQSQAAAARELRGLPGQVLLATHSSEMVAQIDPRAIRLLRQTPLGSVVHTLTPMTAKKIAVFRRFVERPLGEIFFARLVVFVDGTAERTALPVMLEPLLGKDPAGAGVTFIDLQGMTSEQLSKAIDAMGELGAIPWLVFVDNDDNGLRALDGQSGIDGTLLTAGHPQVVISGQQQLERMLIDAGFHIEIRDVANAYLPRDHRDPRHPAPRLPESAEGGAEDEYLAFLAHNKGWAAELIAARAVATGKRMPPSVVTLAAKIRQHLQMPEPDSARYRSAAGLTEGLEE